MLCWHRYRLRIEVSEGSRSCCVFESAELHSGHKRPICSTTAWRHWQTGSCWTLSWFTDWHIRKNEKHNVTDVFSGDVCCGNRYTSQTTQILTNFAWHEYISKFLTCLGLRTIVCMVFVVCALQALQLFVPIAYTRWSSRVSILVQHQDLFHFFSFCPKVEVKPYVLDDQICDECQGLRCAGRFAPFFCANIMCLQYYCEACWTSVHTRLGREFHKPLVKEGTDRPRVIPHRWC